MTSGVFVPNLMDDVWCDSFDRT